MTVKIALVIIALAAFNTSTGQWTQTQLQEASPDPGITKINSDEKDVILYLNLCRLFPREFADKELARYEVSEAFPDSYKRQFLRYKKTLMKDLGNRKPAVALQFDQMLYEDASCYSNEIAKADRPAHKRVDCKESSYSECISLGLSSGKDIAIQWLVDVGVPSLGHRHITLDPSYRKIGISVRDHFKWRHCAVAEFE